jgi:hypothetical protein
VANDTATFSKAPCRSSIVSAEMGRGSTDSLKPFFSLVIGDLLPCQTRLHSTLAYVSPVRFEQDWLAAQAKQANS